jgi:hypothetical protein
MFSGEGNYLMLKPSLIGFHVQLSSTAGTLMKQWSRGSEQLSFIKK